MNHGRSFKLAALCAVGLLAALASASKPARSADNSACRVKITKFAQLAYFQKNGVVAYQYVINFWIDAPRGDEVGGEAGFGGGGGERGGLTLRNIHTGANHFIDWTDTAFGADNSHQEAFGIDLECYASDGGTDQTDSARRSTRLYRPGESQPLVQPWVNGCPDWLVIDSRGSGEALGTISPPGETFVNKLRVAYYQKNLYDISFVIESLANPYPAEGNLLKYILAKLPLPLAYRRSEAAGVKWLKDELGKVHNHCPSTFVYLSGYSQGAQVTGDVYQSRTWPNFHGAVLFGDLKFNLLDWSDHGNFDRNPHTPLGHLYHGYLGARPVFRDSRVWTFCHKHDPACQGWTQARYGFKYHDNYDKRGEPQLAAKYFVLNP